MIRKKYFVTRDWSQSTYLVTTLLRKRTMMNKCKETATESVPVLTINSNVVSGSSAWEAKLLQSVAYSADDKLVIVSSFIS